MSNLTIEEIGELSRTHQATPQELRARQLSIASGLRPHNSKLSACEMADSISGGTGSLLACEVDQNSYD